MGRTSKALTIVGARENNLKDVAVSIPHNQLTVVTGLSGSGKSSLAFDTVYAEGQRRYIETFSPYTRQFFDKVKKPDVDSISGVRPAVAIQQRTRITSSRSTVGSLTNINDYLKVLWYNLARPQCNSCGIELSRHTTKELAELLCSWVRIKPNRTFLLCAVVSLRPSEVVVKKSTPKTRATRKAPKKKESNSAASISIADTVTELASLGFSRLLDPSDATMIPIDEVAEGRLHSHDRLFIVLDRLKSGTPVDEALQKRITDSVDQAYQMKSHLFASQAKGLEVCSVVEIPNTDSSPQDDLPIHRNSPVATDQKSAFNLHQFSPIFHCPQCSSSVAPCKPGLFSFNHPIGACPECKGFGKILTVDRQLCVPNPNLSLKEKAIQCWSGQGARIEHKELLAFCASEGIRTDIPWKNLPEADREKVFTSKTKSYWGVIPWFKWIERKTYKMHVRVFLSRYRTQTDCPTCNGTRLKPEALVYRINGKTLPGLWNTPIDALAEFLDSAMREHSANNLPRAIEEVFSALSARLGFLNRLGLSYLTLERQARTLSGGETQRVNLATALGSELISTQFVLDEPSVGLHARDSARLSQAVRSLADRGNSVLVVEHDLDLINSADHIIELGPHAGAGGGEITFEGPIAKWAGIRVASPTFEDQAPVPGSPALLIKHAQVRNLKNLSLSIPLKRFVCLTGVSGSGKSSLAHEVIVKAYDRFRLNIDHPVAINCVDGFDQLDQVLVVDQAPLAKSPRANIATYSGVWDSVRSMLAGTDEAQGRGLSKSSFSFNVDGGRCPECKGAGFIREDMQFLSDVFIPCEFCLGKRFQQTVLDVTFKGKNVSEILSMSVDNSLAFFEHNSSITSALHTISLLGLGHLTLGHPLSELSGGEAQRLKLVPVIESSQKTSADKQKGTLLIFDEPTTGLHQYDVQRLVSLFALLRSQGHSILCIEHNLGLIAAADWIIDLGPDGGEAGGSLLACGAPKEFIKEPIRGLSLTGQYLKHYVDSVDSAGAVSTGAKKKSRTQKESAHPAAPPPALEIRGAREHNLKNLSLDLPLNRIIALTGVSGSGKSTLAKDIIYAEGQRRYLDCLSPYARQFIKELQKPELDSIKNVMPTICVYQHTFQPSRLSTVATMSEIYNFLRLLFAKTGIQHCPDHPHERIAPLAPEDIGREIASLRDRSVRVLAPIIKMKKGNHRAVLERAVASEFSQIRVDGVFLSPTSVSVSGGLEKSKPHTIEFVVGKFNPSQVDVATMTEMVAQALSLGGGTLIVHRDAGEIVFSTDRTCPQCKRGFFKPDPEDLSFNSKRGRCTTCDGAGTVVAKGRKKEGSPLSVVCPDCSGARIGALGRNLRLGGKAIHEAASLTPSTLQRFLDSISFSQHHSTLAEPILKELIVKANTLIAVGLDHVGLARDCTTLSSGELQRLRLSTAMGSTLSGAMYIFDEPSAGLHPLDSQKILAQLDKLIERDNSIIMIEHDSDCIRSADYVIDIGPGGGRDGGSLVFEGPLSTFLEDSISATARGIRDEGAEIESAPNTVPTGTLSLKHGACNSIKDLTVAAPLGSLVVVAGVSGAGKSSFLHGIVADTLRSTSDSLTTWERGAISINSSLPIERVIEVDQKPIGANSRSTPASYLKIFDHVRTVFSGTNEARSRGWGPGFFSYNSGNGRCPECKGLGAVKLEMSFLPDAQVGCETCQGLRYTDDALSVRYLGRTISEVLRSTFEEAKLLFANHRRIHHSLHLACELGLGYLALGQSSTTLSGGESQRIKLVSELSSPRKGHSLYILDEPTTGLHKADVARLVKALRELVRLGNSVFVIEHDRDMILAADHVIEFGPGPGDNGGKVIFEGAPRNLRQAFTNWGLVLRSSDNARLKPTTGKQSNRAVGTLADSSI